MLRGRRVLLCVTGGVAAYKTAYLARRLVEAGAEVRVVMTEAAHHFVGPQTFAAITGTHPVTTLFAAEQVSPHTELGRWAEVVVVAPATAATIARVAAGLSDDPVSATLLATIAPVVVAPAMHTEMWEHPATRANLERLRSFGYLVVGPGVGALAGGDEGTGRMVEPEEIVEAVESLFPAEGQGIHLLVTAGGTREAIDPVRYIGNRSSGKMGHAIADEAARRGYRVTLVTTSDLPAHPAVEVVKVESAEEMLAAVTEVDPQVAIMAAAVADFRPTERSAAKIARGDGLETINLTPTPDILGSLVSREPRPFVVGFAAETGDRQRAERKAKEKGVDLMVYNDVTEPGSGFGSDTNRVVLIDPGGGVEELPLLPKPEVAARLLDRIATAHPNRV